MKRILLILCLCLLAAITVAAGLWWRNDRAKRSFYTDGERISQHIDDAYVREILWQPAIALDDAFNTDADEYEPRLSLDGSTLLLVRGRAGANADLYMAQRDPASVTGWSEPQSLIDINTDHDELGPSLSPDGRTLLFASNRPGGSGGYDLWLSHRGDFGWSPPGNLGPEINSAYHEYGPSLAPDGSLLLFTSNRPTAGEEPTRQPEDWSATVRERYAASDYDLYSAIVVPDGFEEPIPLLALNTEHNEGAPVFSPAGDFLYFCSDRPGGHGGFDLYRSRRLNGEQQLAESLGGEINSSANEMDPAPDSGGFTLIFSSDRPNAHETRGDSAQRLARNYDLHRSESREVFVRVGPRPPLNLAALWAWLSPLLLWLLLLLLALTLLVVSWKGVRSRRFSLLARCVLASVVAHLLLMTLLTFWQVTTTIANMVEQGSATRVVLSASAGSSGGLAGQLRGGVSGEMSIAPVETAAANKAERIERSPGAAAELVRLSMNRAAAGPEDASPLDTSAPESHHATMEAPQSDVQALAQMRRQESRDVQSPRDARRDAFSESSAVAQGKAAPSAVRAADAPRVAAEADAKAAIMQPSSVAAGSGEHVRVAAETSESREVEPASTMLPQDSQQAMPVGVLAVKPIDIAQPREGEAMRMADGERRGPAVQASAAANASRASGASGLNATSEVVESGSVAVAPSAAIAVKSEAIAAGISGTPGDATTALPNVAENVRIASSNATAIGDAQSTDASQIALPFDVAATGAGHADEIGASLSAGDARGAASERASAGGSLATPALAASAGAIVPTTVGTGGGGAPEAVQVGDARATEDSVGDSVVSARAMLPTDSTAIDGVAGGSMTAGDDLALPAAGALAQGVVPTSQPGDGMPTSALAGASGRRDASGGARAVDGASVAFSPSIAGGSAGGAVETLNGAVSSVSVASDSSAVGVSGGSAPSTSDSLGLDIDGPSRILAAHSLNLPTEVGDGGNASRDEAAAAGPRMASAGHATERSCANDGLIASSGDSSVVALAPGSVAQAPFQGQGDDRGVGTSIVSSDAASVAHAGAAAPSSHGSLDLDDALPLAALATGALSLPGDSDGEHRERTVGASGDTGPSVVADGTRIGRAMNDDGTSLDLSTGSVSIALSPDHLRPGGAGLDALDASTTGVTGAISDADTVSGFNAAPVAAALTALALPDAAPGHDLTLRLPSDIPPNSPYAARNEVTRMETVKRMGGSDETEKAVAMALAWFARHQSPDGRWATRDFDADCRECKGEGKFDTDVATTALALLCFLGADHTHLKEGRYQANVQRGIAWLLEQQQPDGDLRSGETMYSHGIASIALAEAYGMTLDPRLREPVRRAVEFIDAGRNRNVGGWRYEPRQAGDTSVTGWQVMALMSAKRAGLPARDDSFAAASAWMVGVSMPGRPGRYAYQPGQPPSPSMSAEGMFIQQLLGMPREDERMRGSVEYILENMPRWDSAANTYYWYYATLAMFQYQGEQWTKWNDALTRVLLKNQKSSGAASGSWDPEDNWSDIGGRVYQTAICTLCLEVYYRYLPMYKAPMFAEARSMVSGTVTDAGSSEPLAGATVRLDLSTGIGALVAVTDSTGRYALALPELPADFVALSASLDGYTPITVNIAKAEAEQANVARDFALERRRSGVVVLESDPQVHHLGNNDFEGAINSQFQKQAEGSEHSAEFTLEAQHLPPNVRKAELVLKFKGAQAQNSIYINDRRLGTRLNGSPRDGSFGEFRLEIPLELLREGVNSIRIRASSSMGDLDDFEFVNVQIQFDAE